MTEINSEKERILVNLNREKFIEIYNCGVEAVYKLVEEMLAIIINQSKQIEEYNLLNT